MSKLCFVIRLHLPFYIFCRYGPEVEILINNDLGMLEGLYTALVTNMTLVAIYTGVANIQTLVMK